jgi:hypothetical protein
MGSGFTRPFLQELHPLIAWRHDALPKKHPFIPTALHSLLPVDWASVGMTSRQKPKTVTLERSKVDWLPSGPLPQGDAVCTPATMAL